jgi:FMN phosphatase YigB (HAD superfamily)
MKIGVDFDRVLFKTDEFNEYLKENTGLHHVDGDVYDDHDCYSPEKHAELCGIDTEEVFDAIKDLNRFLYPDVDELNRLKPEHELVIVTRGEEKFQKQKIRESGAERLFDRLLIVQEGSKDVGIDFLIDDREEEIERAGVEGFVLDRSEDSLKDAIEEVEKR